MSAAARTSSTDDESLQSSVNHTQVAKKMSHEAMVIGMIIRKPLFASLTIVKRQEAEMVELHVTWHITNTLSIDVRQHASRDPFSRGEIFEW